MNKNFTTILATAAIALVTNGVNLGNSIKGLFK